MPSGLILGLTHLKEPSLCLSEASSDGLFWLLGEGFLFDDVVMQVVAEVFGAGTSSMAIVDAEERAGWPGFVLAVLGFHYIQYDRHPVFVVVPYKALISIGGVGPYDAVSLVRALGRLVVGYDDARTRRQG